MWVSIQRAQNHTHTHGLEKFSHYLSCTVNISEMSRKHVDSLAANECH